MKKLSVFILLLLFSLNTTFACKIVEKSKDLPEDFKESCYEKVSYTQPDFKQYSCWRFTYKIVSPEKIDTFIYDSYSKRVLPYKLYKNAWENIDYSINLTWDKNYLQDNNYKTYLELDTSKNSEVIINFDEIQKAGTLFLNLKYESDSFSPNFMISEDWINYISVTRENLTDYDFKYIKIIFIYNIKWTIKHEKIKISELSFKSKNYEYLIQFPYSNPVSEDKIWNIVAYSNNMCNWNYPNLSNTPSEFDLSKDTETINITFERNPKFDALKDYDKDSDGIIDSEDNCPDIANPMQRDTNWDGRGDLCSDDDKDWIIWNEDNCVNVYNPDQKDVNINKVWDKCEFDKDEDGIYDELDNCVTDRNPDQKDEDWDWIGDACDNCYLFNPTQTDKNENGLWDVCEENKKRLEENDKDEDWIIDFDDNCKEIANKDQKDTDKDGIWDACDNCLNIQNTNQKDENENGIGDMCEDSDKDWIDWYQDNCINVANPDQKDSDNDWIWDMCEDDDRDNLIYSEDNCPFDYNPDQRDVDNDWIWNICDDKDDRIVASNKWFFIGLFVFIWILFALGIYFMIRKLNSGEKS